MTSKDTVVKIVLLALAALALLTLLAFNLYNIRSKNAEAALLMNKVGESNQEELAFQSVRMIRDVSKEEIADFESFTLSGSGLVSTIESLEKAGRTLGLETKIISVGEVVETSAGGQEKVRIVLEGEGAWAGAYSLIKAVESLPQRIMLESASLSKGEMRWKARVEFSLYSFD